MRHQLRPPRVAWVEAMAQTQDEDAATSALDEDLDNPALADLTRGHWDGALGQPAEEVTLAWSVDDAVVRRR